MFQRFFISFCIIMLTLPAAAQEVKLSVEELIKSTVTGVAGHDVLMSRISIPANTTLPRHSHPTEEFLYILGGEAILRIDGREDRLLKPGAAVVIPAGAIHTAVTHDSDALALTTRVQPKGQPVRIPAMSSAPTKD